ncbi:hypothetical protein TCAL_00634 [Tigriopus californicus]|uniref:G-protein coupled receptors family 1 profile domain-containing protein n=1 Tax=Tigriopus californicus TaxID=6832 RepID=A0A553PDR2_TIGCA|nr:FMRFamide receptor-like [Tigriopus californicus]TRY75819.1 hypothetical protein TCAL_00634 [Tigriopus californicus]|eukprot:TCALIF_00634-PA protein Name:"Similar to FR FMRFamide receptor (Drosophila melanogaster)" AED:0.07 eAED:0.07 QI:0/-1/0/1/-1/1/1/0/365
MGRNPDLYDPVDNYSLAQEYRFYNPHLQGVTSNEWIVYGILMPMFGTLSVLLNILIFIVLANRNRRQGQNSLFIFLQCLSGYDILVSTLSLFIFSVPTLCKYFEWNLGYLNEVHPLLMPFLMPFLHMAITGSDYLNLAAAVERFIALDRNFRRTKTPHYGCLTRRTLFYCVVILLCTILFNVPLIFEREVILNANGTLEVIATSLRFNDIYIKMYRLMAEFLIFKVTTWISFMILFLSLRDRINFYFKSKVRKTLTVEHYLELMNSRIILGINSLFYITNALPLVISLCHMFLVHLSDDLSQIANLCLILNSTFKFFIYVGLSRDFRRSVAELCGKPTSHWTEDEAMSSAFLDHAKVVTFAQSRG